jgi:hypothetical protein
MNRRHTAAASRVLPTAVLLAACSDPSPPVPAAAPTPTAAPAALHTAERAFTIELPATVAAAAPMFGPVREREWEPGWAPTFVHPTQPAQTAGAVFTTSDAHGKGLWVLTDYDPSAGRIAYVVLQPDLVVAQLRIELSARGDDACAVTVTSRRTALSSAGNEVVDRFALHFAAQGPHWQEAVAGALRRAAPR